MGVPLFPSTTVSQSESGCPFVSLVSAAVGTVAGEGFERSARAGYRGLKSKFSSQLEAASGYLANAYRTTKDKLKSSLTKNDLISSIEPPQNPITIAESAVGPRVSATSNNHDLITLYRGVGDGEANALLRGGALQSNADRAAGGGASPGILQKYFRHSYDSSNPPSPYVALTQSPSVARHFIVEDMPQGFMGAIKDFKIRFGLEDVQISPQKSLLQMQFRKSDISRTFHYAQDEVVALGGVKPVSVNRIAVPQNANGLNYTRVGIGSAGLVAATAKPLTETA